MKLENQYPELKNHTATQILIVRTAQEEKEVLCFEKNYADWNLILKTDAFIGKNGVTSHKKEGDGKTPLGLFPLGFAFGVQDFFSDKYPYHLIQDTDYWVDDIDSKDYNKLVQKNDDSDWCSAEHLINYKTEYQWAIVIEYNYQNPVSGAGSAIFLHCKGGNPYTAGCVAIAPQKLEEILNWLDSHKNPHILITDKQV